MVDPKSSAPTDPRRRGAGRRSGLAVARHVVAVVGRPDETRHLSRVERHRGSAGAERCRRRSLWQRCSRKSFAAPTAVGVREALVEDLELPRPSGRRRRRRPTPRGTRPCRCSNATRGWSACAQGVAVRPMSLIRKSRRPVIGVASSSWPQISNSPFSEPAFVSLAGPHPPATGGASPSNATAASQCASGVAVGACVVDPNCSRARAHLSRRRRAG